MRRAAKLIAGLLLAAGLPGHDVITTPITFSREISRLFYSHCVSCHRQGGTAFSLATYEEARNGQTLRRLFEGNAATDPDAYVLISWNEIAEGTYVQPLRRWGTRYLDVLRSLITAH